MRLCRCIFGVEGSELVGDELFKLLFGWGHNARGWVWFRVEQARDLVSLRKRRGSRVGVRTNAHCIAHIAPAQRPNYYAAMEIWHDGESSNEKMCGPCGTEHVPPV